MLMKTILLKTDHIDKKNKGESMSVIDFAHADVFIVPLNLGCNFTQFCYEFIN